MLATCYEALPLHAGQRASPNDQATKRPNDQTTNIPKVGPGPRLRKTENGKRKTENGKPKTVMNLTQYQTIVFDCDGVILDSNRIKTEAFRTVAEPIDTELADELVRYHIDNGGISRYRKFDFFIGRCRERGIEVPSNEALCKRFGDLVRDAVTAGKIFMPPAVPISISYSFRRGPNSTAWHRLPPKTISRY